MIDDSITSESHSSRVRHIILHYTSVDTDTSLRLLSQGNVSAHYLITDALRPHIYRLVDEGQSAWHAGDSRWFEQASLNATSIGVELVNQGRIDNPNGKPHWAPYPEQQVNALIHLLQDLITRHNIPSENIIGHSDAAPQRKTDPGPLFPWKQLAQSGIGRWYDESAAASYKLALQQAPLPSTTWFQETLQTLGYNTPRNGTLDRATRNVIAAFQMHYRPSRHDGKPDIETAAIMKALLQAKH